jgi:hypothetical protein
MKKTILTLGIVCTLLNACAKYEPIVDTKGKSKFETSNAVNISDDILHCQDLAKRNTTFVSNISFWLISPKAETKYTDIYRKCMLGRNHQVLN